MIVERDLAKEPKDQILLSSNQRTDVVQALVGNKGMRHRLERTLADVRSTVKELLGTVYFSAYDMKCY